MISVFSCFNTLLKITYRASVPCFTYRGIITLGWHLNLHVSRAEGLKPKLTFLEGQCAHGFCCKLQKKSVLNLIHIIEVLSTNQSKFRELLLTVGSVMSSLGQPAYLFLPSSFTCTVFSGPSTPLNHPVLNSFSCGLDVAKPSPESSCRPFHIPTHPRSGLGTSVCISMLALIIISYNCKWGLLLRTGAMFYFSLYPHNNAWYK